MLKKPEVGQIVVTGRKECCGSEFEEGTVGKIVEVTGSDYDPTIKVKANDDYWYHCSKCLRRPKKGETL